MYTIIFKVPLLFVQVSVCVSMNTIDMSKFTSWLYYAYYFRYFIFLHIMCIFSTLNFLQIMSIFSSKNISHNIKILRCNPSLTFITTLRANLTSDVQHPRSLEILKPPLAAIFLHRRRFFSFRKEAHQTRPALIAVICRYCANVWVGVHPGGRQQDLRGHVKLDRSRYISIPEGEGQFVPVIWRVHGDSLTVIQSLATLSFSPFPHQLPFPLSLLLFLSLFLRASLFALL